VPWRLPFGNLPDAYFVRLSLQGEHTMSATSAPAVHGSKLSATAAASSEWLNRLLKGNLCNPQQKRVAELRLAMLRTVTPQDIEALSSKLLELAKDGSFSALKLYLAYVIGTPSDVMKGAACFDDNDIASEVSQAWDKVDVPAPMPKQTPPQSRPAERPLPDLTPVEPLPSVTGSEVNGGKRLTRQQRRALRRQTKAGAPKLNGGNGWTGVAPPADDPLAALARQRDLLR
jgi:hypothetical protein